jgi:hypothetical protein
MNTNPAHQGRPNERGNVLFLILIAVALFAALSYAVTQSSRSGGGDAGKETNLVNSAQITQYPSGIRTAIVRMIIGGADINELRFNAPSAFTALTDNQLAVFHPSGGGATYSLPPVDIMSSTAVDNEWFFNGENQIVNVGTTDASSPTATTADLIAFLPGVTPSVCAKLNESLGLPTSAPAETGILFDESMDTDNPGICNPTCAGGTIGDAADVNNALNGQPFGCFTQGGLNVYYHVLVER